MRTMVVLAALMVPFAAAVADSSESKPQCVNVGTPDEGWMFQGELVVREQCSKKVLVCGGVGEAFEHYWAVNLNKPEQVVRTRCSRRGADKDMPICKDEGWLYRSHVIRGDCAGRLVRCEGVGTSEEGWRSYGVNEISFLGFAHCSQ